MSDEYPKQMQSFGQVSTVFGPPDDTGMVAVIDPRGRYTLRLFSDLSPLPSPDDEVEVVVKMTRRRWDMAARNHPDMYLEQHKDFIAACRAHRDAEDDQ